MLAYFRGGWCGRGKEVGGRACGGTWLTVAGEPAAGPDGGAGSSRRELGTAGSVSTSGPPRGGLGCPGNRLTRGMLTRGSECCTFRVGGKGGTWRDGGQWANLVRRHGERPIPWALPRGRQLRGRQILDANGVTTQEGLHEAAPSERGCQSWGRGRAQARGRHAARQLRRAPVGAGLATVEGAGGSPLQARRHARTRRPFSPRNRSTGPTSFLPGRLPLPPLGPESAWPLALLPLT